MQEKITIRDIEYTYFVNYKDDNSLRESFNKLTSDIYSFSFENWYQANCWTRSCIPYSLTHDNVVVASITANILDFVIQGEKKTFVQIGTVMTAKEHRHRGLSHFLLQKVLDEWKDKSDMIYLFANDTVLDFYPKYGFQKAEEYQATKSVAYQQNENLVRKLNLDEEAELTLFQNFVSKSVPMAQLAMQNNLGLIMFYCICFELFTLKDKIYYIEELETIAIAEHRDEKLILHDVFSLKEIELDYIIEALLRENTTRVELLFTPIDTRGYEMKLYKEEDLTLFVDRRGKKIMCDNMWMFPALSHT